jgi:alkylated DNA repair dioxygenase AlkB
MTNLLPRDGEAHLRRAFLAAPEADQWLERLLREVPWAQTPIKLFGKSVLQPRLTAWYGDADHPYGYSGVRLAPAPWPAYLLELRARVEAVAGIVFTGVLLNYYRDGQDSMGWHQDDESELGPNPTVASLSLGTTRRFLLRRRDAPREKVELRLGHGDLLVMGGATQHHWQHAVPKASGVAGARINLTFRSVRREV